VENNVVEINVRNKSTYSGEGEYIGRPSPLGNPYKISYHFNRHDIISYYAQYIRNALISRDKDFLTELNRLFQILINNQKLNLICWCAPKACHGDVIRQLLLNRYHTGYWLINGKIGIYKI
jgi:hypothetical protein